MRDGHMTSAPKPPEGEPERPRLTGERGESPQYWAEPADAYMDWQAAEIARLEAEREEFARRVGWIVIGARTRGEKGPAHEIIDRAIAAVKEREGK